MQFALMISGFRDALNRAQDILSSYRFDKRETAHCSVNGLRFIPGSHKNTDCPNRCFYLVFLLTFSQKQSILPDDFFVNICTLKLILFRSYDRS